MGETHHGFGVKIVLKGALVLRALFELKTLMMKPWPDRAHNMQRDMAMALWRSSYEQARLAVEAGKATQKQAAFALHVETAMVAPSDLSQSAAEHMRLERMIAGWIAFELPSPALRKYCDHVVAERAYKQWLCLNEALTAASTIRSVPHLAAPLPAHTGPKAEHAESLRV